MSDAVRLALLTGGFLLIGISIGAGTFLIYQWIRQHALAEQGAGMPDPTTPAGMDSCIGAGMAIVGSIQCDGPAQVFGEIEGELHASDLLIGGGAQVEGSVIAISILTSEMGQEAQSPLWSKFLPDNLLAPCTWSASAHTETLLRKHLRQFPQGIEPRNS